MTFLLPKLTFAYDALEPYIDAKTMEIHHGKHHQTYTDKFNAALEKHPELFDKKAEDIITNLNSVPGDIRAAVRNHGGGYLNHFFFWQILSPAGQTVSGALAREINKKFSSFEEFKKKFSEAALNRFGSGWAWLVINNKRELEVMSTANQDSPLTESKTPLLTIDVWEHSYYLLYNNRRADYINAWWNVINWKKVQENFENGMKKK